MNWLTYISWSPYIVGFLIGVLLCLSFLFSNRGIGCSTAYARTSGIIEKLIRGKKVHKKDYYQKFEPKIDWEWLLVAGIIIGAFLSSVFSGTFKIEIIPKVWMQNFGSNPFLRIIISVLGGILVGFGARMTGGCTSGHGITGTSQLAVASWLATIFFFVGGIITAYILYYIGGIL